MLGKISRDLRSLDSEEEVRVGDARTCPLASATGEEKSRDEPLDQVRRVGQRIEMTYLGRYIQGSPPVQRTKTNDCRIL